MKRPRSYNGAHVTKFAKRRKANLRRIFGSKCCLCGFDEVQEALEFHHVNPRTKEFGISETGQMTRNLNDQLNEARKCILVCANCHRGIHQGVYKVPENWQSFFDENIAKELQDELVEFKSKTHHYCQNCGKEITRWADKYCPECMHLFQRRCERPDRDALKELIRTVPFTRIASDYNVSDNAIRKWCKAYNLPSKKSVINQLSDEEWEEI